MSASHHQIGTINLQPHQHALDGTHLNWLIDQWIAHQHKRVTAKTLDGYRFKAAWFCDWWQKHGAQRRWLITQEDFAAFEIELRDTYSPLTGQPLSYHTRRDVLRRVRQALHWAWVKHHTQFDYSQWIPQPAGGPAPRRAANVTQLVALMDAAGRTPYPVRDQAVLALMIGMGLRANEVAQLNIEDVTIHADGSGYARVHGKRTRANPSGVRDAALEAAAGRFVVAQMDALGDARGPLFRSARNGSRLGYTTIYRITKAAIAAAGLKDVIQACHDLRRAFCTYYARHNRGPQGADALRRQMGHANYSQTTEYNLMDVEDLRQNITSPLVEYRADGVRRG